MDHLCYLCLVIFMLSRLIIVVMWSPAGIGLVRVFSDVLVSFLYFDICHYQNMEKPLKHQRRLGLG